jgi:hypothetical protein
MYHTPRRWNLAATCKSFKNLAFGTEFAAWWRHEDSDGNLLYFSLHGSGEAKACKSSLDNMAANNIVFGGDLVTHLLLWCRGARAPAGPDDCSSFDLGSLLTSFSIVFPNLVHVTMDIAHPSFSFLTSDWTSLLPGLRHLSLYSANPDFR